MKEANVMRSVLRASVLAAAAVGLSAGINGADLAQEVAEALAARFPEDETIKESVEAIRRARERRANLPKRPRRPFDGRPSRQYRPGTDRQD